MRYWINCFKKFDFEAYKKKLQCIFSLLSQALLQIKRKQRVIIFCSKYKMDQLEDELRKLHLSTIQTRQLKQKAAKGALKAKNPNTEELIDELLRLQSQQKSIQQLVQNQMETPQANLKQLFLIKHLLKEPSVYFVEKLAKEHEFIYQPEKHIYSPEEITERKHLLEAQEENESQWTDENSMAHDDFDEVLLVDDEIANAMEESEGSEEEGKEGDEEEESEEHIEELEEEFVVNGKSDHHKLFKGHSKFVVCLALDKANNRLVSGGGDDLLNLYDLKQLQTEAKEIEPIKGFKQQQTVSFVKFNYNYEQLLSVTDKYLSVYNCKSLEYKRIVLQECKSLSMHPLGNLCAAAAGHEVNLYNLNNCSLYNTYYTDREVTLVEFAPGGKHILIGGKGQLKIIQPKTEQTKKISGHNFHQEEIVCIDFRQNLVLTGSVDGYACLSNWTTGASHARTDLHTNSVENVLFYNNVFLTGCVDGFVRWYDVNTVKKINNFQFNGAVTRLIRVPDSPLVAVSTFKGDICVMDPRDFNHKKIFSSGSTVHDLLAYKEGILAACEDGFIKYFDTRLL